MSAQASFELRGRNPDVLTCIANLPNDEVFTPPEFAQRAGQVKAPRGAKAGIVLAAIRQQLGDFQLSEIERACPSVGRDWIRSLLTDLKAAGEVSVKARQRDGAIWGVRVVTHE